ncbi:hypothetical protein AJ78_06920 [Emergomyces pasteurianus Ep9510]|uniref:Uncharacterized protein n=1 Tax=Emergomyces pasteurianus Ep9510 TaxID=1447872 RepID=A0A1J9P8U8_9EURO|nr:hypothetical protein AJ78_06920 [Emergomyces pasteurianus Ep9510]
MSLPQTFTERTQEASFRKLSDTFTLRGNGHQSPMKDVTSPPVPVANYTVENLKDRLIFADRELRSSRRKPSPIGTRALQIYKDACARLLSLEQEEGDLEAAKDIWRVTLRTYDQSLQDTPCMRVACSSDAWTLRDRLINLQKSAFYARYADILTELCILPSSGIGAMEHPYWIETYRKLQSEADPSYWDFFNGGHQTYLAIHRACDQIGLSHNNTIQTIREYATRNDLKHLNIFPLIKSGKFDNLKAQLYHDSCILPLLIHNDDWKLIRLLNRVIQSVTDLWFDRGKIDPGNYQTWTYTKALRNLYLQLQGDDYSVPQKQLARAVAKKIRKRLRDVEDKERAMESLSMTMGPLRLSENKKAKRAVIFSSSQLHAERERAVKMTADWNDILSRVRVAEYISSTPFGNYYEPAPPLAIIPELSSEG